LIASAAKSKRECSTGRIVRLRASSTFCDWRVTFVETEIEFIGNIGVEMFSVEDTTVIFSTKGIKKVFRCSTQTYPIPKSPKVLIIHQLTLALHGAFLAMATDLFKLRAAMMVDCFLVISGDRQDLCPPLTCLFAFIIGSASPIPSIFEK
jgi:hypothetical protein